MTNSYKLIYFDMRARGEPLRMILNLAGQQFEDERWSWKGWEEKAAKMPLAQVPVLEDGDFTIVETTAIARYLGDKHGLQGETAWHKTVSDMLASIYGDVINKLWEKVVIYKSGTPVPEGVNLEKNKEECTAMMRRILKLVEGWHQKQPNSRFINGNQITVADIFLYCALERAENAVQGSMKLTDWAEQFVKRFEEDKKVADYLKNRKPE